MKDDNFKNNQKRRYRLTTAALLGSALLTGAVATTALSQVSIGQLSPDGVSIKGKVTDVFGDTFVLDDGSGRILVQTGPGGPQSLAVTSGETVTVTGLPRDKTFDARKIARDNGEVVFAPTAPPPAPPPGAFPPSPPDLAGPGPAGDPRSGIDREAMLRVVRDAGVTPVGEPVRHPKHIEVNGRTGAGKNVIVSLDRFGRLDEIEDDDHDHDRVVEKRPFGPAEAERAARDAGFTPRPAPERRKHHFEVLATNAKGEMVELHVDFAGNIYKQVWLR